MLPSPLRLNLRAVPQFFERAQRVSGRGFGLWWMPQKVETLPHPAEESGPSELAQAKFAIVVPRKLGRGAQRVKIKRQWRERLITLWKESPDLFETPHNVVVVAFRSRVPSIDELRDMIQSVLGLQK